MVDEPISLSIRVIHVLFAFFSLNRAGTHISSRDKLVTISPRTHATTYANHNKCVYVSTNEEP